MTVRRHVSASPYILLPVKVIGLIEYLEVVTKDFEISLSWVAERCYISQAGTHLLQQEQRIPVAFKSLIHCQLLMVQLDYCFPQPRTANTVYCMSCLFRWDNMVRKRNKSFHSMAFNGPQGHFIGKWMIVGFLYYSTWWSRRISTRNSVLGLPFRFSFCGLLGIPCQSSICEELFGLVYEVWWCGGVVWFGFFPFFTY